MLLHVITYAISVYLTGIAFKLCGGLSRTVITYIILQREVLAFLKVFYAVSMIISPEVTIIYKLHIERVYQEVDYQRILSDSCTVRRRTIKFYKAALLTDYRIHTREKERNNYYIYSFKIL